MSVAKIDNIGGGVKLVDINPNKTDDYYFYSAPTSSVYPQARFRFPVNGYKKISIKLYYAYISGTGRAITLTFKDKDGNDISTITINDITSWTDYDIPSNAETAFILQYHTGSTGSETVYCYYALFA